MARWDMYILIMRKYNKLKSRNLREIMKEIPEIAGISFLYTKE